MMVVVALAACRGGPAHDANVLTHSETWCPEGFEVGPQDTCFAIPDTHDKDTPILVYLHGMYEGRGSVEEWAAVREASRRGFAVVIPRGKRGLCAWKVELRDHFCWPTEVDDPHAFKAVVGEWDRVLWQVDSLLEGGAGHRRYVLGFSNGGLFAEYLAANGLFQAQAYGIVNGGGLVPPPKAASPPPMFLLTAEDDPKQGTAMRALRDDLAKAGWPHAWCTRPGGHALLASDVDAALHFFAREAVGALRPQGGVYPCEMPPTR
jgi:predicted esterase